MTPKKKQQLPRGWWTGPEGSELRRRHASGELSAREVADLVSNKHGVTITVGAVHKAHAKHKGKGMTSRTRRARQGEPDLIAKVFAFVEEIAGVSLDARTKEIQDQLERSESRNRELEEELRAALTSKRDQEQMVAGLKERLTGERLQVAGAVHSSAR